MDAGVCASRLFAVIALSTLSSAPTLAADTPVSKPATATPRDADLERARALASRFPETVARIEEHRLALSQELLRATSEEERDLVRQRARAFVATSIRESIFPAWNGTPWAMGEDDDATVPHQPGKRIACGKFVVAVLRNAGLRLRYPRDWGMTRALYIQRSLAPQRADLTHYTDLSPRELAEELADRPDGIYLVGLEYHVGFVTVDGDEVRFVHANYVDAEWGVVDESLAHSEAIAHSEEVGYWITPLFHDRRLVDRWLLGHAVTLRKLGL